MTSALSLVLVTPHIGPQGGGVTEVVRLLAWSISRQPNTNLEIVHVRGPDDASVFASDWPDVARQSFKAWGPKSYLFAPFMALHLLRIQKGSVVHCHGIWTFPVAAVRFAQVLAPKRLSRVIYSPHGMLERWILQRSPRLKAAVSRLYQRRALQRAQTVHALTPAEASEIEDYSPGTQVSIVPNFVPTPQPPASPAPWLNSAEIAHLFADSKKPRMFLFLGRIHDKKGWRELLDAWTSLCAHQPRLCRENLLVLCGWVDQADGFDAAIKQAQTKCGNVIFAGPQYGSDKDASLAIADVFLLPSKSEGLPMVVLEAAHGKAVIAMSQACNLCDFFDHGAVDTGASTETIASALKLLVDMSEDELSDRSAAAQMHMNKTYSEERVLAKLMDVYRHG